MGEIALGPFCALCSSLTWAIGTSAYAQLTQRYSPYAINFLRALVALPLFFLVTLVASGGLANLLHEYRTLQPSNVFWFSVSLIASHGLGDVLFLASTRYLSVSVALAIASSCPIWNTLAGYFFAGQAVTFQHAFALFVTLVGLIVVILSSARQEQTRSSTNFKIGLSLAIGTSILWATNAFSSIQGARNLPPGIGNTVQLAMTLVFTAMLAKLFKRQGGLFVSYVDMRKMVLFVAAESFLGNFLYLYGITHSNYAQGLMLASLAPVMSVPINVILGRERFSLNIMMGIIITVAGSIALLV